MLGMPLYARTDEWDAHAVVVMRLSAYMKGICIEAMNPMFQTNAVNMTICSDQGRKLHATQ